MGVTAIQILSPDLKQAFVQCEHHHFKKREELANPRDEEAEFDNEIWSSPEDIKIALKSCKSSLIQESLFSADFSL